MTSKLYRIIERAFNHEAFEEALSEAIGDLIDYEAAADLFVETVEEDITATITEIALEALT